MKCEKCGIEILEGTICSNCKTEVSQINPLIQDANNIQTTNQIPEQYDPVANLMNEEIKDTVILEKNEVENLIPFGDNNTIPQTPVNENVVNVLPQYQEQPKEVVETQPVLNNEESSPVEQNNNQIQEQVVQPVQNNVQQQPKKTKTGTIVIIAVAVVLILFIVFFVLPLINATKTVTQMFNEATAATFVTEVQYGMGKGSSQFVQDSIKQGPKSIIYTNIENISKEDYAINRLEDESNLVGKTYYFELDRFGKYKKVVMFDETYCYQKESEDSIETTDISTTEIFMRGTNDSQNGCTGEKPNK